MNYKIKNIYKFMFFITILLLVEAFFIYTFAVKKEEKVYVKKIYVNREVVKNVKNKNSNEKIDPRMIFEWYPFLEKRCKEKNLDIKLMMAIYSGESGFNPKSVNPDGGATGLGQMRRDTFEWLKKEYIKDNSTFEDLKKPKINIKYTTELMYINLKISKGNVKKALWMYGGCVSLDKKGIYLRYIKRKYKELYGEEPWII